MSEDSPEPNASEVTLILNRLQNGAPGAVDELVRAVYSELKKTAEGMVRKESKDLTLMTTDLVHEAFLRLFPDQQPSWQNRRHFFGSAAIAMRRVLVDHARKKKAGIRIPKEEMLPIETAAGVGEFADLDLESLDLALDALAVQNPRQAKVVELKFFAGLTEPQVAKVLNISHMTVSRDWKVAKLRLLREMRK